MSEKKWTKHKGDPTGTTVELRLPPDVQERLKHIHSEVTNDGDTDDSPPDAIEVQKRLQERIRKQRQRYEKEREKYREAFRKAVKELENDPEQPDTTPPTPEEMAQLHALLERSPVRKVPPSQSDIDKKITAAEERIREIEKDLERLRKLREELGFPESNSTEEE